MKSRAEHIEFQRSYFDKVVRYFCEPLPEDVERKTREIVRLANINSQDVILDVGTGTGVLVQYFINGGVPRECITGCDLSSEMLEQASSRYPGVRFIQSDIDELTVDGGKFTKIFFNGCFGNMYHPVATLRKTRDMLSPDGQIIISHPLGNNFLKELKDREPELIMRLLPSADDLRNWCAELLLEVVALDDSGDFYLAVLQKREKNHESHSALP